MSVKPAAAIGAHIVGRCTELAALTEEPGVMTRTFLTPMHKATNEKVAGWMREAGMTVTHDAIGNVVGRYAGAKPDAPVVMIGSHLDTVRNGGRYDGIMGVITGIEAVSALNAAGRRLPFAIDVVGFGDEEGVRFDATLIGSRAIAGTLPSTILQSKDANGVPMSQALTDFGLDPKKVNDVVRHRGDLLAYLEVHIEQGPVLERMNLPLGVVTAICGATRRRFRVVGLAGHAGTVPMDGRQDALVGASEVVLAAEAVAREFGVVATVGRIAAEPGAINVVPGAATFTLDLRAEADIRRNEALAELDRRVAAIAKRRNLQITSETFHDAPAAPCAPHLQDLFGSAIESLGLKSVKIPSGAGHDGMAIVAIAPIGMLFVRCEKGISHNPAEAVITEDVGLGSLALSAALDKLATTVT